MQIVYNVAETAVPKAVIKVIGIGSGGCNAVNNMIANDLQGVEFISANTDAQSLHQNRAPKQIQLGATGLGAGGSPEVGRDAALEKREQIAEALRGANMVFITTGMGGGTGTGATPVVAEVARELGILTVAVVTRPFAQEGHRVEIAREGIESLKNNVDSLIVIPNDKLMEVLGHDISFRAAFRAADDVLRNAVAGISEVITSPGIINLDFADIKRVMANTGIAMMGSARATGLDRARIATEEAISSPLLDNVSIDGAKGVLVNITTAPDGLGMSEYQEIMNIISEAAHPGAMLKYGTSEDDSVNEDEIRVTIIATGLQEARQSEAAPNLRVHRNQATGTDYAVGDDTMSAAVLRSGRASRAMNLSAADFSNPAVVEDFETPAVIRRQID